MKQSICGANCKECTMHAGCKGCLETGGAPFGKQCFIAKYIAVGGIEKFQEYKQKIMDEINAMHIPDMPKVKELYALVGNFVNLEYKLPSGQNVKFLDDSSIYLGTQLASECGGDRCFGLVAGNEFLLICTYGEDGLEPEIVLYKSR